MISGLVAPAGGNLIIIYTASVTSSAPLGIGATIENTVTVDGTGTTAITASATVVPAQIADLTITKSVSPVSVTENGTLTYTFLIQNFGSEEASTDADVTVTDTLDPVLTSLTATLDGAPLALTTGYTYDELTGAFATVPGVITVPAATFSQDARSGEWSTTPGTAVLTISGIVS